MSPETVDFLAVALIFWATTGAVVFVALYAIVAPWYRSSEGRHMMVLTTGLASLGTVSLLVRVIGKWSYYDLTVLTIYLVIGWELWRKTALLMRAQIPHEHLRRRVWRAVRDRFRRKDDQ